MSFEWNRIHKWEDNIERDVTDAVYEYVRDYYDVDEIEDLTEEQIDEVRAFSDEHNEYSPMQIGFSNLFNEWEDLQWEKEHEND
jgi:hypothetical protein